MCINQNPFLVSYLYIKREKMNINIYDLCKRDIEISRLFLRSYIEIILCSILSLKLKTPLYNGF